MTLKYPKLLIVLIIYCITFVYAQDVEHVKENVVVDKSNNINQILVEAESMRSGNFQQFEDKLKLLEKSEKIFSAYQRCLFNYLSIYKISLIGQFESASKQLNQLFGECEDLDIKLKIKSLLANLYVISGDYLKAISSLDFLFPNVDKTSNKTNKYLAYMAAIVVYDLVDQYQLSLKFSDLLLNENPPESYICKAKIYKYISLIKSNNSSPSESEIETAIKHCQNLGEIVYAQGLNTKWIESRLNSSTSKEEVEKLLSLLTDADGEIENTNYKNLIAAKNSLLAQIHEKLGNHSKATSFANLSIEASHSIGATKPKIDALQVLINYYQYNKDFEKVNSFLIERNNAEKKLYSDKQAKLMAYQTVKHDSLANTLQIESLNQRNTLLQLENKLAEKSKTNQLLLTSLLGIIILFLLILGYRIYKQQKLYKRLSERDPMTKIYNRKGIKDYMDYLLPYSKNKNEIVAYGIFDLDLFKRINDKYGHAIGDWVIKNSVMVCRKLSNNKVTFARLGGEEFALIINDSSLKEVEEFAEKCRVAIQEISTQEETGFDFTISASFGITTTEISGYDYADLMQNADAALYQAKNGGRNQVQVYQGSE